MAGDEPLIVPILLPTGSLHFASVKHSGTVQDVIDALGSIDEVRQDILGDLQSASWALQLIRNEPHGRQWEEAELESLGDGAQSTGYLTDLVSDIMIRSGRLSFARRTVGKDCCY
jgi:hypothetical protein